MKRKYPKVTIIIPLYVVIPRFFEDLKKFSKIDYPNYEVLVVSDKRVKIEVPNVKLVITGKKKTGPAEKRDIALKKAKGEICAFIDDDAYPHKKWLKEGVKSLALESVVAVGGPGVTPKEDPFFAQLTGLVYESRLASGKAQDRFLPLHERSEVKDWPAYNLMVKTKDLINVGGYGTNFYGGEDTFLCLKLIREGKKIVYNPKMVIYHHRRPLFLSFMQQIFNVGVHRGYFAKTFPETSRKFFYFLPSILTIGFLSFSSISIISPFVFRLFIIIFSVFFGAAILSVINKTKILGALVAAAGIIVTHLTYGVGFIKGILIKDLKR